MEEKHTYMQVTGLLLSELSHDKLSPGTARRSLSMTHLHPGLNFFTL